MTEPLRVAIVDDHPLVIDGLTWALELAGRSVVAMLEELVASQLLAGAAGSPVARAYDERYLTERERQILGFLADGSSNGAIADRLGIGAKTVANHVSTILTKLQVTDRSQAALVARRQPRR